MHLKALFAVALAVALAAGVALAQPKAPEPAPTQPPATCPLPGKGAGVCPMPGSGGLACPMMPQLPQLQQKIDELAKQGGIKPEAQKELSGMLGQMQARCQQMCPLMKQQGQPPAAASPEPPKK